MERLFLILPLPLAMGYRPQDGVKNVVEPLAHIIGQNSQDKITVFLQDYRDGRYVL